MKIYKKIDRCFSTSPLRRRWLILVLCLLVLWQLLWLALPALKLIDLYTYDQLFEFYSNLSAYRSSWIVNMIMALAAQASVTLSGVFTAAAFAWQQSMTWIVILSVLVFLSGCSKIKAAAWAFAVFVLTGAAAVAAAVCLQADSIMQVLYIIRFLGWFLIIYVCFCAGNVLKEVIVQAGQIQAEIDQI